MERRPLPIHHAESLLWNFIMFGFAFLVFVFFLFVEWKRNKGEDERIKESETKNAFN